MNIVAKLIISGLTMLRSMNAADAANMVQNDVNEFAQQGRQFESVVSERVYRNFVPVVQDSVVCEIIARNFRFFVQDLGGGGRGGYYGTWR